MSEQTKDIIKRSIKTAVQSFIGAIVAEGAAFMAIDWTQDLPAVWVAVSPLLIAALSAAASAAWNVGKAVLD